MNAIRTFGVDRISDFELLTTTFKPKNSFEIKAKFQDVVGLTYEGNENQKVILAVKPQQVSYLKSLPLHHSQKVLAEKKGETLFQYHLKPNFEFIQQVFMLMDLAIVVEPAWLRDEIKCRIEKMSNAY